MFVLSNERWETDSRLFIISLYPYPSVYFRIQCYSIQANKWK